MTSKRNYWLIKSEPSKYPWAALVADGRTSWDGVRNFEARNHLRAMTVGDWALYYHSTEGKEIVGVAEVAREAYADATADDGDWSVVDFVPAFPLTTGVPLATVKATESLREMKLVTRSRISVVPVTAAEFAKVLSLGGTRRPPKAEPLKALRAGPPEARGASPKRSPRRA